MTTSERDEALKCAARVQELKEKSTKVVAWYAHHEEVRGPFFRWFTVSKCEEDVEKGNLAWWWDDCAFAAEAMNSAPVLARALLAEAAENARLRKLIEIADVLITNENAIEDWNNTKQIRVM